MRVLIVLPETSSAGILMTLHTSGLVSEIMELIGKGKHSRAMISALSKGRFEREVGDLSAGTTGADLILFKDAARWDLKK